MNTLYILGGPPRTAKTSILHELAVKRNIQLVSADAIQHGLRNVLIGEPRQMLRKIELSGNAEYKTSITEGGDIKPFANHGTESELALQVVIGMIDYYGQNGISVAFEGALFTPSWVSKLTLPDNFVLRAAFVGYTNPSHADNIISYAKSNPNDWINHWLTDENGDETKIRDWVTGIAQGCHDLASDAKEYGYPYFDISTTAFKDYTESVQKYLLAS